MKKGIICILSLIFITLLFGSDAANEYLEQSIPYITSTNVPYHQPGSRDTVLGDIIFEMDIQTVCGDNQLLGVEFDGTYFYLTGGGNASDPNKVYVVDTNGVLIWTMDQPGHSTGWGWRDLAWDRIYAGADRIDTLYGSVDANVDKFGIDLTTGTLTYYGAFTGAANPSRALGYDEDSLWFFAANWTPYTKFSKTNSNIQTVSGPGSSYGAAYDTDDAEGGWVWWFSQIYNPPPWRLQIDQMDAITMNWTGVTFGFVPSGDSGIAGGLCFHEGFRGMDVLFAVVQGTPVDLLVGLFVRFHDTGIEEHSDIEKPGHFGFANIQNPVKGHASITYTTTKSGNVELTVYDGLGRLVKNLVNGFEPAGTKIVLWDIRDDAKRNVQSGIYFLKLDAENRTDTEKLILSR